MTTSNMPDPEEVFLDLLRQGQSRQAGKVLAGLTELSKGAIAELALMLEMPETDQTCIDRHYTPHGLVSKRWVATGRPKKTAHEDATAQAWVRRVAELMKAGKSKNAAIKEVASIVKMSSGLHPHPNTIGRYCNRYKRLLPPKVT